MLDPARQSYTGAMGYKLTCGQGAFSMKLLLALASLTTCQTVPGSKRIFGPNDALNPKNVMSAAMSTVTPSSLPMAMKSFAFVPAVKRKRPGTVPSSTIRAVRQNFVNAYMPFCPDETLGGKDCLCKETYPHAELVWDKATETLAVVAINQKFHQIVVSYRLTMNLQNWLDNFNMQLMDVAEMPRGVRVHRGIYSNYMATYHRTQDAVGKLLDNPRYTNYTLLVTGYSLGGGLAIASVPSWVHLLNSRQDPRRMEVIGYSGPRVGNRAFAEYIATLNVPVTRYTNENDIVPHAPGRKLGYVHAGAEVYGRLVNKKYTLRHCAQTYDEDPTCSLGTFASKSPVPHAYPMGKFIPFPPYC